MRATKEFRIFGTPVESGRYPCTHSLLALNSGTPSDYLAPLTQMVRSGEIEEVLLSAMERLVSEESSVLAQGRDGPSMHLWQDEYKLITLSAAPTVHSYKRGGGSGPTERRLTNIYSPMLIAQLGHDPIRYTKYRIDALEDLSVFAPKSKLIAAHDGKIGYRETLLLADFYDVIDFHSASGPSELTISVSFPTIVAPLVWLFDKTTLTSVRSISSSSAATRVELLVQLFEELKFSGARSVLDVLQDSPMHFIRWRAVQAMLRLHGMEGIEAVKRAHRDPHPHVRRAAERTLTNLAANNLL